MSVVHDYIFIDIYYVLDSCRIGRQRESPSSRSGRSKRKHMGRPSTSCSTTFILINDIPLTDMDSARELLTEGREVIMVQEESRQQPRDPRRDPCLQDPSLVPRHAPRYIKQLAAIIFKVRSMHTCTNA